MTPSAGNPARAASIPAKSTGSRKARRQMSLKIERIGSQCRRRAAAVLEVLAGVLRPGDAAKALGLSLPAYYKLEGRALEGLIRGCQPPTRGPRPTPDVELQKLRREHQRLRQELHRYQALARTSQRAVGLPSRPPASKPDARGRRRRKPTVRALKVVKALHQIPEDPPQASLADGETGG